MLQAQVLNRAAAIDREEFLYLIQPIVHSAQRLAHGMLRSPTEAEDVVQEATLKAWSKIGTFQAGTDFKSWFLKIVANECRQTLRSAWWKVIRKPSVDQGSIRSPQDQFVAGDGVRQALNQLSYDHRVVVVLRYYLDLSFEQIGTTLAISPARRSPGRTELLLGCGQCSALRRLLEMNEVEFSGFIKRGLGSPAASTALVSRITQALHTNQPPARLHRSFRVTKGLVLLAALVALAVPTAVVATSLLTPHDVAVGMPGGSAIFTGTNPTCVVVTEGVVYRCTLAHAPTVETVPNYLGAKEILQGTDSTIVGGCIGASADGLHWDCYIGDAAVQHGILVKSMLGQPLSGPTHG